MKFHVGMRVRLVSKRRPKEAASIASQGITFVPNPEIGSLGTIVDRPCKVATDYAVVFDGISCGTVADYMIEPLRDDLELSSWSALSSIWTPAQMATGERK